MEMRSDEMGNRRSRWLRRRGGMGVLEASALTKTSIKSPVASGRCLEL
jgi:hypothetical protein